MSAAYTPNSFGDLRYGVVQVKNSDAPTVDLPAPERVPEVAADKVPDKHDARTSPDGHYKILLRREGEPGPLPDADIDWIDHTQVRDHVRDNADVWEAT